MATWLANTKARLIPSLTRWKLSYRQQTRNWQNNTPPSSPKPSTTSIDTRTGEIAQKGRSLETKGDGEGKESKTPAMRTKLSHLEESQVVDINIKEEEEGMRWKEDIPQGGTQEDPQTG